MSNIDKASGAYTAKQEAAIVAASPVSFEVAKLLGDEFGKSAQSVIAKIHSMKANGVAVDYLPKAKPVKRPKGLTKAQIVQNIANGAGLEVSKLNGLEKAGAGALSALADYFTA